MTPDKKRAILEAAARACGLPKHVDGMGFEQPYPYKWNPIDNPLDTSAMCAVLDIDTYWFPKKNLCFVAEMVRGLDTSTMKNTTAPPKERNPLGDSRQPWWRQRLEDKE